MPILIAARNFGHNWANTHVVCFSDNTQVVATVKKRVSINSLSMSILTELFWLSVINNFYITARHIPGTNNVVTDMLSQAFVNNTVQGSLSNFMCCRGNSVQPGPRHI